MRRSLSLTFAFMLTVGSAMSAELSWQERTSSDLLTGSNAILCIYATDVDEASKAIQAKDKSWLKQLNCIAAKEGLPAIRIEPEIMRSYDKHYGPWKVRLKLPSGDGITMFGKPYSFKLPDGRPIPMDYW